MADFRLWPIGYAGPRTVKKTMESRSSFSLSIPAGELRDYLLAHVELGKGLGLP